MEMFLMKGVIGFFWQRRKAAARATVQPFRTSID